MKKTKNILIPTLIVALISAFFCACGGSSTISVKVKNSLEYNVAELYVAASGSDNWGESLISDVLAYGSEGQIFTLDNTSDSVYDIKAVDTDGDNYYFYHLPLSQSASLELVMNTDECSAIVRPQNGEALTIPGDFEFGENHEDIIPAPTANDPLDESVAIPGFEDLIIPFPSTMQVAKSNADNSFIQLEAVNDPDNNNGISFNLIALGGTYEQRLNSSDTAQDALVEIVGKVCEQTFPGMLIKNIGSEFFDCGTYYSALSYLWMSGEVFEEASGTPIRGVLECRYYGTNYILAVFTLADEGAIQNYFEISRNIIDVISLDSSWITPKNSNSNNSWSDPGDADYDPWSDPGDYDYDPWSDPGDYYDGDYTDASDPGDYYDGDYTDASDPGDYYDY
ncbi:MAG: hypothetical protein VB064_02925 [Oscillospiraceae bacterium]|nr:hypothetical protein [Oscillospiraceae bacterium]